MLVFLKGFTLQHQCDQVEHPRPSTLNHLEL